MGIRFNCPNGHKLNVKDFQAGLRGVCPFCNAKFVIPTKSTRGKGAEPAQPQSPAGVMPAAGQGAISQPGAFPTAWPGTPATTAAAPLAADPFAVTSASPQGVFQTPAAAPNVTPISPQPVVQPVIQPFVQPVAQPTVAQPIVQPVAQPIMQPVAQPVVQPVAPARPTVNDPLSEANVVWYIRPAAGGQFGPASSEVMRAWIGEGRVSGDSLVWREGWRDWLQAGDVFPQLQPGGGIDLTGILPAAASSVAPTTFQAVAPRPSNSTQKLIITALALTVVVLVAIFLWVFLKKSKTDAQPAQPAANPAAAVSVERMLSEMPIACCSEGRGIVADAFGYNA